MSVFRIPRLEPIFGARLDQLTYSHITALKGSTAAAEATDLDYKKLVHAKDESGKVEFCKDVAAMANGLGGVLILGVAEDGKHGIPDEFPGVDISDAEIRRFRELGATRIFPHVQFDVIPLPDAVGSSTGLLLIVVPRSSLAPHTYADTEQRSRGEVVYPIRNGAGTRWMPEPEIAAAYRARFREAVDLDERLEQIERGAVYEFYRADKPWRERRKDLAQSNHGLLPLPLGGPEYGRALMTLSLICDQPGRIRMDKEMLREIASSVRKLEPELTHFGVRSRRIAASDRNFLDHSEVQNVYAELHTDGAGCIVSAASDLNGRANYHALLRDALRWTYLLARHARDRVGGAGTATLRVRLLKDASCLPSTVFPKGMTAPDISLVDGDEPTPALRRNPVAARSADGEASCPLDELADGGSPLAATVALAATECLQAFGIPEMDLISSSGALRQQAWRSPESDSWRRLAQECGLEVDPS